MAKIRQYVPVVLITVLLILINGVTVWKNPHGYTAMAESRPTVITDLEKDEAFDAWDYPHKDKDYSLQVIQIAESAAGNVYVYTYQPHGVTDETLATEINMSLSETVSGTKLYPLTLMDRSGVFGKYRVGGVSVSEEPTRYYNITSIYRALDKEIDGATGNDNTGDKKAYPVRNVYKVTTENGKKVYSRNETYVVNIVNPYSDYMLYTEYTNYPMHGVSPIIPNVDKGFFVDAHYVAFSTDWAIDRLLSATVQYEHYSADGTASKFLDFNCGADVTYGKRSNGYAYPKYSDKVEVDSSFWGSKHKYTWNRIQTVTDFIASERLTAETEANLKGLQWVLRFTETERTQKKTSILGYDRYETHWTIVDRVAVLRLEFETDGVVYNLGAVSDAVSGDGYPGNTDKVTDNGIWGNISNFFNELLASIKTVPWWVWLIVGVVGLSVALSVLSFIFPAVKDFMLTLVRGIWYALKYLLIGVWVIVSAPFKLLKKAFTKSAGTPTVGKTSKRTKAGTPTNRVGSRKSGKPKSKPKRKGGKRG